jgi:hypothetical protein
MSDGGESFDLLAQYNINHFDKYKPFGNIFDRWPGVPEGIQMETLCFEIYGASSNH